jgi:hypothetical protein
VIALPRKTAPNSRPQRDVNHPGFTFVNHKAVPRAAVGILHVRRLGASGLVVPAAVGAMAALAAVQTFAQQATQPLNGLRPAFEDASEEGERREAPRRAVRRPDPRSVGVLPRFANGESRELPRFGNLPGSGASKTGFVSTNPRRPTATPARREPRRPGSLLVPAPLSITAPGRSPASTLLRATASGTSVRAATPAPASAAAEPAAAAAPRNPLVRIPDGTTAGGLAGTVNAANLTTASATLLRRRVAVDEDAYAPLGLRTGAFLVLPAIEVTGGYDTNPARVPSGRGSSLLIVSPELIARSDWQRHEVTAALRGSYTTYDKTPELDRPAFDGKVTGRLDVARDTALIGEGIFIVGTDNPGSPNVQAGLTQFPIYTTLGGTFGLTQRFNRVEVTAKGAAERTEYQPSEFTDGTSESNDDRNYNRFGGTLRSSYDLMPGLKPFVEVGADTREHDLAFDRAGLQRDSTGWFAKGGTSFAFSRKLAGEVAIGWLERSYKDPSLQQLSGFLFDAALIYSLSALTNIKLIATTVASETTVPGTAGVFTRNAGIEVEHSFRRWLVGAVKFNYGLDDYVGSVRKDDRYAVSAALAYKLNRIAQIKGEFRQEWLRSTVPGVDYTASVILLGMRLQR